MEQQKCHKAAFTGFRQSAPMHEGLAILNPYLGDEEDNEETKKFSTLQKFLVSETPSDLRLKILHRLPQQWGVDVKRVAHLPMASWYNPVSLLSTAVNVLVTFAIGERTDTRPLYALMDTVDSLSKELASYKYRSPSPSPSSGYQQRETSTSESSLHIQETRAFNSYELQGSKNSFYFDFVADTGDGWNSTFTVATLLAQPFLEVFDPYENKNQFIERGRVLIIGGDLCYPDPSPHNYQSRFVEPFRHALWPEKDSRSGFDSNERRLMSTPSSYGHPHAFAIPGNHDWLDGLVAFRRVMCSAQRLGGWLLPQKRSYFALQLPDGWWLFGIDDQLTYDIDDAQFRYFRDIAATMASTDRVIVAMHRPFWILDGKPSEVISVLFEKSLGDKLRLILAGDLHNYSHYERHDGKLNLVVCGGGGAFLHPTHKLNDSIKVENTVLYRADYNLKTVYPSKEVSKDLCFESLKFLTKNYSFGLVTMFIYLFMVGFLPWTLWVQPAADFNENSSDLSSKSFNHTIATNILQSATNYPFYLPLSSPLLFFSFIFQAILSSPLSFSLFAFLWICLGAFVDIGTQSRFWSVLFGFIHVCVHVCVAGYGHFLSFHFLVQPSITDSFNSINSYLHTNATNTTASSPLVDENFITEVFKLAASAWASSQNINELDTQALISALSSSMSHAASVAYTDSWFPLKSSAPLITPNQLYFHAAMLFFNNVSILVSLMARSIICITGLIGGPVIMGLYFTIAAQVFGRHTDDLFAGTRIEDYKSFLRLKIDAEKHTLTLLTVGIDKVKTEWPALRGKGKIDETTTHMANPLWYTPQSVECHIVEKLTIAK